MITLQSKDFVKSLPEKENYVLLQTCNRSEIYTGAGEIPPEVARHLFRVACGLESRLIGETEIQHQIKQAYEKARVSGHLCGRLHRLFQYALSVGKRVRTETDISKGAMSYSKAVLEILKQDNVDVCNLKILIIGVSHLNKSVVKYLTEKGSNTIFVANRTYQKALALAIKYNCHAVTFEKLHKKLQEADILISATSAPHLIIRKQDFIAQKPMIIFDLAVPRDIDPAIGRCPDVTLYGIEDIEARINCNRNKRLEEIKKAERIIEEEISAFYKT